MVAMGIMERQQVWKAGAVRFPVTATSPKEVAPSTKAATPWGLLMAPHMWTQQL